MPTNRSTSKRLARVFNEGFVVKDIVEPLASFDVRTKVSEVHEFVQAKKFKVVGIRDQGHVVGYAKSEQLGADSCRDSLCMIEADQILPDTAPLADVVLALEKYDRLFVSWLGEIAGIVTRTDMQKPPVRMWLFGMITLIEMRFTQLIERVHGDESWQEFVSEGRLSKARVLQEERQRRNQTVKVLDCLQFSDKGQVIARSSELRGLTKFESRGQVEKVFKGLERLRNNLAHSQDIVSNDWEVIVLLTQNLERVVSGPPALDESSAAADTTA
ncbi:MAG: hypothetical protein ACI9HK_000256 [Pirellulaceae bacterium]|jgi:hypothetical protein